jgi:predicted MFS family arabinose efflux permease
MFGAAAALSTVMVSTLFRKVTPRKMVAASLLVMAIGVAAPLIRTSLATLVVSALCVGGTFMVTTMAGAQEAARVSPGSPTRLMAALSGSFAIGQLIGPILVGLSIGGRDAFTVPSVLAVLALLIGAAVLLGTGTSRSHGLEPST